MTLTKEKIAMLEHEAAIDGMNSLSNKELHELLRGYTCAQVIITPVKNKPKSK